MRQSHNHAAEPDGLAAAQQQAHWVALRQGAHELTSHHLAVAI